jgi:hypothetical protein
VSFVRFVVDIIFAYRFSNLGSARNFARPAKTLNYSGTKDLGINSLTPNFVLFATFVVKTQGSTLVAAPPRWALCDLGLRGE